VNCPKFAFAFFAWLQTGNVISFSRRLLLLVTHPTSAAAATKEAFTCPNNSLVNQRLKSPVMLLSCFPPFSIVYFYMFTRVPCKLGFEF
jgi:hypothetical protein